MDNLWICKLSLITRELNIPRYWLQLCYYLQNLNLFKYPAFQGSSWIASEQTEQHSWGKRYQLQLQKPWRISKSCEPRQPPWSSGGINIFITFILIQFSCAEILVPGCSHIRSTTGSILWLNGLYIIAQIESTLYNTHKLEIYNEPIRIDVYWLVIVFIADCSPPLQWCVTPVLCWMFWQLKLER